MATIVVQVAGEIHLHVDAAPGEHFLAEEDQVRLIEHAIHVPVLFGLHPDRQRQAEDHFVPRFHVPGGNLTEVLHLRHIQVALKLTVAADQPPPVRQLEHEVAPPLPCPPAGKASTADVRAEEPREGRQPVVPVVVAGHGVHVRTFGRHIVAERSGVRGHESALVSLLGLRSDTLRRRRKSTGRREAD